jgi:diguanylate cyclase (GGDEF)-like protein
VHVEDEPVVTYMFEGHGRVSYLVPRAERSPGVSWVASTGRSCLIADGRELERNIPRVLQSGGVGSALLLPLALGAEVQAVVMLVRRHAEVLPEGSIELAAPLVDQAASALALLRARTEAGTDAVAGCMNHRAMRRRLEEEIDRATRAGSPLSCLLIDLDDFKLVNDVHGHPAGDAVLREVVQALVGEFRAFDRVARYGGDEFVVILPNADVRSAAIAAGRALERLRAVRGLGSERGTPASIGVAQWRSPMSVDDLLMACDAALLRAKREGKGRVTRAAETV